MNVSFSWEQSAVSKGCVLNSTFSAHFYCHEYCQRYCLFLPQLRILRAALLQVCVKDPGIPEKDCSFQTPLEIPINVAIWRTHGFTVDPVSISYGCCDTPIMKAQLTANSCYSAFHVTDFLQFLLQLIKFVSLFL